MTATSERLDIQIALDRIDLDRAAAITTAVAQYADWIEVGTSLVKLYGMPAVRRIVAAAGATPVLADLKTADDARTELAMAFDAGARSATVLGLSSPKTLELAVGVAAARDAELMVDLMELDELGRSRVAGAVPTATVLAAHVPKDAQITGINPTSLLGDWAVGRRLALAGGLGIADVPALAHIPGARLIIGSAVTAAPDPRQAAAALRAAVDRLRTPTLEKS